MVSIYSIVSLAIFFKSSFVFGFALLNIISFISCDCCSKSGLVMISFTTYIK